MAPPGNYPALLGKLHTGKETVTTPRWVTLFSPYFTFWLFSLIFKSFVCQTWKSILTLTFKDPAYKVPPSSPLSPGSFSVVLVSSAVDAESWVHRDGQLSLVKHLYIMGAHLPVTWLQIFLFILFRMGKGSWESKVEYLYIILFVSVLCIDPIFVHIWLVFFAFIFLSFLHFFFSILCLPPVIIVLILPKCKTIAI